MKSHIRSIFLLLTILFGASRLTAQSIDVTANSVVDGSEWTLSFSLSNSSIYNFVAFQADFALPEGVRVRENSVVASSLIQAYSLMWNTLADGTVRFLVFGDPDTTIDAKEGELFSLTLEAPVPITDEDAHVTVRNVRFIDESLYEPRPIGRIVPLTPAIPTAISTIELTQTVPVIYDLQGRRVFKPQRGQVYIVNGKKVRF